ncbi:prefoldin alpha subunit [Phaffia rhodozyma]|uniref:Prefoldin alpha subunit n=1 Tax=Phaffia rhodozyma TaxID=264483 RepID=A0A0F7SWW1_PHARH|nr:prefoldin alpha subunit [Phaffia rhodozyma]
MAGPQQQISVQDLDFRQLSEVKKQLDDELEHLTTSFAQLKQAQAKFKSCIADVEEVNPKNQDKPILIPLTSSLYVPGKLTDTENVIVDVGTGYYVSKTRKEALTHYTSKTQFVKKNLDTLQGTIEKKQENVQMVMQLMMQRQQQQQQQEAA